MWLGHYGRNQKWARGTIFRKSYPELDQLIQRSMEIYRPLGAIYKQQQKTWYFKGGGFLKFRFVDKAKDAKKYQGHENTYLGFDEAGDVEDEEVINTLRGALRSSKPISERILMLTGNPMGDGHKWLKRRFIQEETSPGKFKNLPPEVPIIEPFKLSSGQTVNWSRVFIPALLEDNPLLMANDPLYEFNLMQMCKGKPWLYRALRYGDWTVKREILGALLTVENIEKQRVMTAPAMVRRVLGVDPTVKGYDPEKPADELALELGDECGIVALGRDAEERRYFFADSSIKGDPTVWAAHVVSEAIRLDIDVIVAEKNNGGELVRIVITRAIEDLARRGIKVRFHVELVSAAVGKYTRAEPVAWDIKDGKTYFVGEMPKYEEEWTTWKPDGKSPSPNRVDAGVWAWTFDAIGIENTAMLSYMEQQAALLGPEAAKRMQAAFDKFKATMEKKR